MNKPVPERDVQAAQRLAFILIYRRSGASMPTRSVPTSARG